MAQPLNRQQSARGLKGLAQSKTWRNRRPPRRSRQRLGLQSPSTAFIAQKVGQGYFERIYGWRYSRGRLTTVHLLLEQHGIVIGTLLLVIVSLCAFLLARKAAQGVARFRDEQHERFVRKEDR